MELKIPRQCAELLADRMIDPQWLYVALLLAPNEAVATLATLIEIGLDREQKTAEIEQIELLSIQKNKLDYAKKYPGKIRSDIIDNYDIIHKAISNSLTITDSINVSFSETTAYWKRLGEKIGDNDITLACSCTELSTPRMSNNCTHTCTEERSAPGIKKVAPTEEQDIILQTVNDSSADSITKAQAFAGTGKTILCSFISERISHKNALYLAFNKVMVDQAKSRLDHRVECRTTDSLAYAYLKPWEIWGAERTKPNQRMPWPDLADRLGLPQNFGRFSRNQLIRQIYTSVLKYCYSSDSEFKPEHLPDIEWPDQVAEQALIWAKDLWARMIMPGEPIPVTPPQVMKVWDLKGGKIDAGLVLFDEAQDANAAFMSILQRSTCRRVLIGDEHQQLYEWRGAVDAMHLLQGPTLPLTKSWRFGPEIAEFANSILEAKTPAPCEKIRGNNAQDSKIHIYDDDRLVQWPITVLARSNITVFNTAVNLAESGHKLHIIGNLDEMRHLLLDALKLYRGEIRWISHQQLVRFSDWDSLVVEQMMTGDPELKRIIRIIEERHDYLENNLEIISKFHVHDPQRATAILSTTHRVKGMEWDRVMLTNDFIDWSRFPTMEASTRNAELNVLYVAATRAVRELYIPRHLASQIAAFKHQSR